jgi:hypothetical protein
MTGQEGNGQVVEVIEGDTTAVFAVIAVEDDEPTGVFVPRTRTETWPARDMRALRRRR